MRRIALSIGILLSLSTFAQMSYTGGPANTSGQCWSIWASGDSALMGYNEGLYRTLDGGTSWELLSNGIPVDVDPRTIEYSNNKLILGTNDGSRIYQSDDFGDSFTGGTGAITSIAIPTASTSGPNLQMIGGTLFEPFNFDFSTNDWTSTGGSGFTTTHGISYLRGDTVWICRGSTTSYSHDNGTTWTDVTLEPQTDVGGGVILSSKALDFERIGNRVFVYTNLTGFPVLYTDDNGGSWSASSLGSTSWSDYGTKFIRVNDNHLLSVNLDGVWKSTDQGATWTLIQSIQKIRTMSLFRGTHLLVGTDEGVCEFDNYGDGSLVAKHGSPATASRLILSPNNTILAGTASGLNEYDPSTGSWTILQNSTSSGQSLDAQRIAEVGDTLFAFGTNDFFKSGDDGATFNLGNKALFGNQTPTRIAELDGKKFAATYSAAFGAPKIFYSTNNGVSYTEATFSNAVSLGYGASGGNFVEAFYETPNALIADMNAGYALSTDGGLNWTFSGSVWDRSFIAVNGSEIYHFRATELPIPERLIEVSTDGGATWNAVPQTGLPNSGGSNYKGWYGVWEVNGVISTYNSFEANRGIYQWNASLSSWDLLPNSAASLEDWDGMTHLQSLNGDIYANWAFNGTWKVGASLSSAEAQQVAQIKVYPNPAKDRLHISSEQRVEQIRIFNLKGQLLMDLPAPEQTIDIGKLAPGPYYMSLITQESVQSIQFLKH